VLIFLLPLLEGACSVPASSAVYLRGEINAGKVAAALDLLRHSPGNLVVTSAGGDPAAAMALGRALRDHNSTVTVRGYCLSACATYVLAGAKLIRIERGSLVGYHHTDTAIFSVLGAHLADPKPLKSRADAELAFIREMGVSAELLQAPLAAMHPVCYDVFTARAGAAYNGAVRTDKNLYVPSADRLRQFSLKVEGANIRDEVEFSAWLRRYGRPDARSGPVFEGAVSTDRSVDDSARLALTPACGRPVQ